MSNKPPKSVSRRWVLKLLVELFALVCIRCTLQASGTNAASLAVLMKFIQLKEESCFCVQHLRQWHPEERVSEINFRSKSPVGALYLV